MTLLELLQKYVTDISIKLSIYDDKDNMICVNEVYKDLHLVDLRVALGKKVIAIYPSESGSLGIIIEK